MQLRWSSGFLDVPLPSQKKTNKHIGSNLNDRNYQLDEISRAYTVFYIVLQRAKFVFLTQNKL